MTIINRYMQLMKELTEHRAAEEEILDKMDLLWQAMTLEEREEVHKLNPIWPPPAVSNKQENNNGNG